MFFAEHFPMQTYHTVLFLTIKFSISLFALSFSTLYSFLHSVLRFEVPLANLAIHQLAGFLVLGTFAFFSSFCKLQCCSKCGLTNGFLTFTKKADCRTWGVIAAIGFTGAFNFGMTSYSLMLLSQADLQVNYNLIKRKDEANYSKSHA